MNAYKQVAKAYKVAAKAYKDCFFPDNTPWMTHAVRVSLLCPPYNWDGQTVALLHDVIEHGGLKAKDLVDAGFDLKIVKAVVTLSQGEDEEYDTYIQRIVDSDDPLAVNVKINDLYDQLTHVPVRNISLDDDSMAKIVRHQATWLVLSMLAEEKGWLESPTEPTEE